MTVEKRAVEEPNRMEVAHDRKEFTKYYHEAAAGAIYNEKLPLAGEILDYATEGVTSENLKSVFDFFGDEEEIKELTTRESIAFTEEESDKFIDSVIAANVQEISQAGLLYKKLMACGDTYRIRGKDCRSHGHEMKVADIDELEFKYSVKNSNITVEKGDTDYMVFYDYEDFIETMKELEVDTIWVRNPMSCHNVKRRGCCPICAGEIPYEVQNLGAFSTLMITEVSTQDALSSMNKGKKENINTVLGTKAEKIKTIEDYHKWADEILDNLKGDMVERRYYEIALLGRLHIEDGKIRVSSLSNPNTKNYLGEFIYRPKEVSYRNLISAGDFQDESLKAQIAVNSFKSNTVF